MGFLSPPPQPGGAFTPEKTPPDPELIAQREQAKARADATAETSADAAQAGALGRLMGTRGARSMFSSTAAGYSRTLGGANV